ncbi:glycoside hydrolase family 31 protein [Alteromonas sp. NFXS44]|uniref:TIM-barrel domain-containing protein n=1 Tax=Alteromonas sp. NFXS44 TaxID=2818435 RepID=UPI0032DECFA3
MYKFFQTDTDTLKDSYMLARFQTKFAKSGLLLIGFGVFSACALAESAKISYGTNTLSIDAQGSQLAISIFSADKKIAQIEEINFNYKSATEWKIVSKNDSEVTLIALLPPSTEFYRTASDEEERKAELLVSKADGGFRFFAAPEWGNQITIKMKDLGGHVFGLTEALQPDNRLSPDLRNSFIDLEVKAEEASIHENFASAYSAFFMNSKGYGAFFDTFARGKYQIAINGKHQIHHDTGTLDWYIFPGKDGTEIHRSYFSLIGEPKSVPLWGLGPIGWRDQNDGGAAEVLDDIEKLTSLRMAFTSWFIDRPYSDGVHGWSDMNFSPIFKDPESWINEINEHFNLEFMTWTTPAYFGASPLPKHLAGSFSYADLSDPDTVNEFKKELTSKQLSYGVKGHKIDRADEGFPVYESWHDEKVKPAFRRNYYAYLMSKVHDDALREKWGSDQVTFVRSAIHKTQPFVSAIWAGDPRTTWDGFQANYANAARSAFMGFPVWGTDVGGYQGEGFIPADLYIRWMQAGSMSGLFEIKLDGAGGEGKDRMPWQYNEDVQSQLRNILADRMKLLPYLNTLANDSSNLGTMMQPLSYRHLDDEKTYDMWDEFYLGQAILVAPVFTSASKRDVYLPAGKWRAYDQPKVRYQGKQTITVDAPIDVIPRFVKENSLFVTGNFALGNTKHWNKDETVLTIHAFPGDVGESSELDYIDVESGNKKRIGLSVKEQHIELSVPALSYKSVLEIISDKKPKQVFINGKRIKADFRSQDGIIEIPLQADINAKIRVER